MPTLTSRRVSLQPLRLELSLSLEQIQNAMTTVRPSLASLEGGWAGSSDVNSGIGSRNAQPPESDPVLLDADADRPKRLLARYYFYRLDKTLRDAFPDVPQDHYRLQAIDLLLSRTRGESGGATYLAAFSARMPGLIKSDPLASIEGLAEVAGTTLTAKFDGSEVDLLDPDIFLWLIARTRSDPKLDEATTIQRIESVRGQDNSRRVTVMNDSVGFDRPAFLVAVAEVERLGPVRISVRDTELDCRVTFDLWRDGSFAVYSTSTHYRKMDNDGVMRARATQDILYRFLPKLLRAYRADEAWRTSGRVAEIAAAASALIARYSEKLPNLTVTLDGKELSAPE